MTDEELRAKAHDIIRPGGVRYALEWTEETELRDAILVTLREVAGAGEVLADELRRANRLLGEHTSKAVQERDAALARALAAEAKLGEAVRERDTWKAIADGSRGAAERLAELMDCTPAPCECAGCGGPTRFVGKGLYECTSGCLDTDPCPHGRRIKDCVACSPAAARPSPAPTEPALCRCKQDGLGGSQPCPFTADGPDGLCRRCRDQKHMKPTEPTQCGCGWCSKCRRRYCYMEGAHVCAPPTAICPKCVRDGERVRGCKTAATGNGELPCSRCGAPTMGRLESSPTEAPAPGTEGAQQIPGADCPPVGGESRIAKEGAAAAAPAPSVEGRPPSPSAMAAPGTEEKERP